jgi:hypothetical protein
MSPSRFFSKYWKQFAMLVVAVLVVGAFIAKAPGAAAKVEAAFSGVHHLLHDADTDGRAVRPLPLLG